MSIRRGLMNQMGVSMLRTAKTTVSEDVQSITFRVVGMPRTLMVACESLEPATTTPWTILTVSAIWSDYNNGAYYGGRYNAVKLSDSSQNNWQIQDSGFAYDDVEKTFTITKANTYYGRFASDRPYYMFYVI